LSSVSHDLRTPLGAILGAASALSELDGELDGPAKRELLTGICDEAERLDRLVANLLDMTRLDAGLEPKREWVPLEELVGSALTRVERRLAGRAVDVSLPPGLPLVAVDPVIFEQLVVNLLDNAIKHTPAGTPIEVTAHLVEMGDGEQAVELGVGDRGPGLPDGDLDGLFEKFVRGTSAGAGGVGLGLAICRAIAVAHHAELRAERRLDGGARFVVRLPLGDVPKIPHEATVEVHEP
jgi:two-component system sensor histidine kinase KdpD